MFGGEFADTAPAGKQTFAVGPIIRGQSELGTLEVFLSPQEPAPLVVATEEAAATTEPATVTTSFAEAQLDRRQSAHDAFAGTRTHAPAALRRSSTSA